MRFEKKVGKKITTLALVTAMAVEGSLSVFAATGFNVSDPALAYLNGGYVASGDMSYTAPTNTSTSYYLRVKITGIAKNGSSYQVFDGAVGYGYGKASAMTDRMPSRPIYIENEGSYNSGVGAFINVDTKSVYNP